MRTRRKKSDRHKGRLVSLGFIFPVLMLCVLVRSFWFQVVDRRPWLTLGDGQYEAREMLPAQRGTLYDRNLNILAMDLPGATLAVDPTQVNDHDRMVETLTTVFHGDPGQYRQSLFSNSAIEYVRLSRGIRPDQREQLEAAGLTGLIFGKTLSRVRPVDGLAQQVIGVTDAKRQGAWGAELSLNDWMRGRDGWAIQQKDAFNRSHVSLEYPVERPVSGQSVVLTLDHVLQTIVEEELQKRVLHHKAKAGMAVLIDPHSGEVLALANALGAVSRTGEMDFNQKMTNRAVQWSFEPGSTFKIVTLAAALERGGFQPDSLIYCENGSYRLGTHVVNDHEARFGWLSVARVIEESSNIGVAKMAQSMGAKTLYEYARNFGFGNKSGIQLPGESSGILRPVYKWSQYSPAFISFGQELSATTLQVASMISVIANGGELVKPRIVRQWLDAEGKPEKETRRQVIRRVVTRRTAARVTGILEHVVMRGSGDEAAVKGIRIAGKTGTAQKSVPGHRGYLPNTRVASFAGFWPAEAPRYALVVVLDEPIYKYWGSHSAAPLFGDIVNRIEGIPEATREVQFTGAESGFTFASLPIRSASSESSDAVRPVRRPEEIHVIPNVKGMSLRRAMQALSALGIEVQLLGHGRVTMQEPAPGSAIQENLICKLHGENVMEPVE